VTGAANFFCSLFSALVVAVLGAIVLGGITGMLVEILARTASRRGWLRCGAKQPKLLNSFATGGCWTFRKCPATVRPQFSLGGARRDKAALFQRMQAPPPTLVRPVRR
jgi:hypothetical protein